MRITIAASVALLGVGLSLNANAQMDDSCNGYDDDQVGAKARCSGQKYPLPPLDPGPHSRKRRIDIDPSIVGKLEELKNQWFAEVRSGLCPEGTLRVRSLRSEKDALPLPCVERSKVVDDYARACRQGNPFGCARLQGVPVWDRRMSPDRARDRDVYTKACADGSAYACARLGDSYDLGLAVAKDPGHAAALYRRACDGGSAFGCGRLASLYANGEGVAPDARRASALFQRACDEQDMFACANLGGLFIDGMAVPRDVERAVDLLARACKGGQGRACTDLSRFYDDPGADPEFSLNMEYDRDFSLALNMLGCRAGDTRGCGNGGAISLDLGFLHNQPRAIDLFTRGCCGGDRWSCCRLSNIYGLTFFGVVDEARAKQLAARDCSGGMALACQDVVANSAHAPASPP